MLRCRCEHVALTLRPLLAYPIKWARLQWPAKGKVLQVEKRSSSLGLSLSLRSSSSLARKLALALQCNLHRPRLKLLAAEKERRSKRTCRRRHWLSFRTPLECAPYTSKRPLVRAYDYSARARLASARSNRRAHSYNRLVRRVSYRRTHSSRSADCSESALVAIVSARESEGMQWSACKQSIKQSQI